MHLFQISFIPGVMVGVELPPCDEEESFIIVLDLFFIRIQYIIIK